MNHCLSDEALLEFYMDGRGASGAAHVKTCPACARRFQALQSDMAVIGKALDLPPPRRRHLEVRGFLGWRPAAAAMALVVAFMVGWSLHATMTGLPGSGGARMVRQQSAQPVQLSMAQIGAGSAVPAVYAAYVQDAFEGDLCAQPDDPLEPGCL
jgi:hypothetical protein